MPEILSSKVALKSWQAQIWEDVSSPIIKSERRHPLLGNEIFCITGGLGSGKTVGSLQLLFLWMLYNRKCPTWWCIAPTHARHEDAIVPNAIFALTELLRLKADKHFRIYYSKPLKIEFFTGQTLFFHSGDRPERMTSANLGGFLITEPGQMKREVYEKVAGDRTRSKLVHRTLGIVEGTPEGDNWYMDEFNIQKVDPERKIRRFILHTQDNAHNLAEGYVEKLERMYQYSAAKQRAYIYGEFHPFNVGNVFQQFLDHRNLVPAFNPSPSREIHICFDFNASPLCWTAWQVVPYTIRGITKNRECAVAESSLQNTDLYEAAKEIGLAFDPAIYRNTRFVIWGDRTGHSKSHKVKGSDFSNLKQILSNIYNRVEIRAPKQVTPIRGSVDITNQMFLYELLLVCDNCKNLRRSYNTTEWAAGKADLKKPAGETHTHHSDGARYRHYWVYRGVDFEEDINERETVLGVNPV